MNVLKSKKLTYSLYIQTRVIYALLLIVLLNSVSIVGELNLQGQAARIKFTADVSIRSPSLVNVPNAERAEFPSRRLGAGSR